MVVTSTELQNPRLIRQSLKMKKDHWDLPELGRSLVNEPECGLHLGLEDREPGKIEFEAL